MQRWLKSFRASLLWTTVATVAGIGISGAVYTAQAGGPSEVKVVQGAYLITQPKLGSTRICLEPKGTVLHVLSGSTSAWWHVQDTSGHTGYITTNTKWVQPVTVSTANASTAATATSTMSYTTVVHSAATLPPGVSLDASIQPRAGLGATWQQKYEAVLSVARSKLGTPYEWGHNEDRGQYGFDCSNYVEYVFHHALGYRFSTASRTQATSVGWSVPVSQMRPGDILVFDNGKHVGIYVGNNQMIQEGGGLGEVGYLSVAPGTYWRNHLTGVKRMF